MAGREILSLRTTTQQFLWLTSKLFNAGCINSCCTTCMKIPVRWKWDPADNEKRKNFEALRRWREENTRLFGPILKTKSIKPLGKKTKRKTEKLVVGEDLDAWFNERYPPNSSTSDDNGANQQEPLPSTLTDPSDESNCATSGTTSHSASGSASQSGEEIVNTILTCKLTPETGAHLDVLESHLKGHRLPSLPTVSGVLARTRSPESQFFLDRWKNQMIAELGEDGFKKHQQETLRRGINLHVCIQQSLSGVRPVGVTPENQGFWRSVEGELGRVRQVQALETRVTHPYLRYTGTFDCVATYRDTICLIDWKTSKKPKPHLSNTFDYPLQVCAYLGAYNADPANTVKVQNGLVVVAYDDGNPAHAHLMTPEQCDYYWRQWLDRLHQYWTSVLYPQQVLSTEPLSSPGDT